MGRVVIQIAALADPGRVRPSQAESGRVRPSQAESGVCQKGLLTTVSYFRRLGGLKCETVVDFALQAV